MRVLPLSLYLHIPFCVHRCGYCDFNTYAGLEDLIRPYARALRDEIAWAGAARAGAAQAGAAQAGAAQAAAQGAAAPVHTIFFGGGTPSLLPADELAAILEAIANSFDLLPQAEITLEANPGTLSLDYLRALRRMGVNRISLGVQSAHPGELRLLERQHDYPAVTRSVSWARQAGFDNLNLDLIFGLPEQPLENWQRTLELALGLAPEHFSLYALSLEHGTPFGRYAARGLLSQPEADAAADMYEYASERLAKGGYAQYEISNWARGARQAQTGAAPPTPNDWTSPALACRHNLQYWRNLPYLGLGAGAHGYAAAEAGAAGVRTVNVLSPAAYIERIERNAGAPTETDRAGFPRTPATQSALTVTPADEIGETMMMGLRLVREGVAEPTFQTRFGRSLKETFGPQIQRLIGQGLLEWAGPQADILRLTERGRLLGNRVFVEFI